jgi:hypothetical protein
MGSKYTIENGRTEYDTGHIFRSHGQEYEKRYSMSSEQRKSLRAIASCRTSVLGGHLEKCNSCGFSHPVYNSCRNNNCPKCQGINRSKWVNARLEELLPVPYFHTVFTVPDLFNTLMFSNYIDLNGALFRAASATLLHFFKKEGGTPAIIAVLHTWGQQMSTHPHIHILVTGGCLSFDKSRWIKIGRNYLFNVELLSAEFKKRFLREIRKHIPDFKVPDETVEKDWVGHCRKPFAGAEKVVEYLGRYTYRSVISNRRIVDFSNGKVSIDYKDYRDTDENDVPKHKILTLEAIKFIRRFISHIPPRNFRRIRFYGILAGQERITKIEAAKNLLAAENTELPENTFEEATETINLCPQCESGSMEIVDTLLANGPPHIIFRNEISRGVYVF